MARPDRVRIGDLMIQEQRITPEQLQEALTEQKATGRKVGRILIDRQWVTEQQIAQALARQLRAEYREIDREPLKPELASLLPEVQARRLRVLPVQLDGAVLKLAMADPTDLAAYDEAARLTRRELALVVVPESQLLGALDRLYSGGSQEDIAGLARELTTEISTVDQELGDFLGLQDASADDAPVVRLLTSVFEQALRARASDIHIEPQEKNLRIRFRIDGVLHVKMEADSKISSAVALRLKLMSGLDISEKRLPQDGRFHVKLKQGAIDVRISTLPTQWGESVVMRLLNPNAGLADLDQMKLPEAVRAAIDRALAKPSGLLLVTGPTGSGKTTTLYAALNALNDTERKIITVEDPVEYRLAGLNQVQVMDKIDLSFARVLRATLRQDPDVILIGEMRDQTTAEIGLRAAMTGHLVLSTLHTNDALSTPLRLVDMGVPQYMVGLSVQLVLAQRLVRTICKRCTIAFEPDARQQGWLRHVIGDSAEGRRLHRGTGCPECSQTGFAGRTGVYEFLEMTSELIDALGKGDPATFNQVGRRQMGGHTLRRDAVRLALEGRTTIEEAMRIGTDLEIA